jgi:Tol biopolymer transport system component
VPIPGIVAGNNTITVTFRVADQADNQFDSALFIDNVSVQPDCSRIGPTLQQITHSNGGNVQTKNGGLLFTPISNGPAFSADNTGTAFAFASTGNYTGDNPNVLQQVFVYDGSYTRVTGLALGADGNVQGVSLSGPTVGALHGRYVAIAATLNGSASPQIYRWDRQTSTLTQITNTTGCVNQNPSISSDGNRVAWETTCSAYTGQNVQKVVYSSFSGGAWSTPVNVLASGTPAATCQGWEPHLSRGDSPAGFLALRSNCGGLAGGAVTATNGDVFRLQLSTNSWKRITMATSAATTNTSISIDAASGVDAGRYIYFISDGNYFAIPNDTTLEIYRYDAALSALQQVTSTTSNGAYISVHQAADGKGVLFAYEFINGNSGRIEVGTGSYDGTITALKVAANPLVSLAADVGVDASNVPSVLFLSNDDLLGQNGDRNAEIYRATTP